MNILIRKFSKCVVLLDMQLEVTMSTPGVFEVVYICSNSQCFHFTIIDHQHESLHAFLSTIQILQELVQNHPRKIMGVIIFTTSFGICMPFCICSSYIGGHGNMRLAL